ncbi:MAG TPA: HD domain-containing phosphohydrolase [Rectinemataceae bacterium]|nr:HD domain-containing phosphohydrolase [Rectinemataceae bacterium]
MPSHYQYDTFFRILVIEDNPDDAFLVLHTLENNFPKAECTHVSGRKELESFLATNQRPDIILSDWSLPQFNGLAALEMVKKQGIDVPFIIVSGKIGEEAAILAIRQGVYDYVLKDNLARLPTAIHHALDYYENEKKAKIDNALIALQATALKVAPAAIAVFDPEGLIEWINPAFEELSGYGSIELLGLNICSTCSALDNLKLETMRDAPAGQKEQVICCVNRRKNGALYFEEEKLCPVLDQDGKLTHIVVIKKDISASEQKKKEMEQDLQLSTTLGQAKSLEGICQNVMLFLKEQYPDVLAGICLYTDGNSSVEKWFGDKGIARGCADANTLGKEGKKPDSAVFEVFSRALAMGEEKIGQLHIHYAKNSPLDQEKLFDSLARQLEVALQRMLAQQKISAQIRNISFLKLISRTINGDMDFEMVVGPLLRQTQKFLDSDAVALYLNDKETDLLSCRAQSGFRTSLVDNAKVSYGQPFVGIAAEEQRIVSIPHFDDFMGNDKYEALIRAEAFTSQYCAPIIIAGKTIGVLEVFQRKPFAPSSEWMILFDAIATQTGLALDYNSIYADLQHAYLDLELSYEATIEGWSAAMDYRDQETEGHSKRVTSLAISLATRVGIPEEEIASISRGALLHDVGKIGIPDSILKKPGPLDDDEWKLMKTHPIIAYSMLSRIPYLKQSLIIPLYHHERWDGSGYPEGLKGDTIPLAARLFSVIDVFDALTSDRPYRKAWSKNKTLEYLREQAGIQFDPDIVTAFISMLEG